MLTDADRELVTKLMSTHFHGYAEVRMAKLKPEVLDELVRVLAMEDARRLTTTEQKVAFLLEVKKQVKKEDALRHKGEAELRCETPVPSEPAAPAAPPPPPPTPDGKISRPRAVFNLGWPNDVFATFRAEFIMREDVRLIKFPPSQEVALRTTGRSLFPVETLVSITYTDDEQAMRKWLQVAIRWSCESEGTCCIFDSIDHCVMNNAVKCILCITREIFDKHLIKSDYGESEWWVKSTFTYMLQQSLKNNQIAQTRSFGYVGPMRWEKMTPAFLKAAYRHPLAIAEVGVPLVLPPVPPGMPLRSMWVRVVRWSRVRAFVNARSAAPCKT